MGWSHVSSILTALQDSIPAETLTLERIQTHSFCTTLIKMLLKTGKRGQLIIIQFTNPFRGSSHAERDRLLSDAKNTNTFVQPSFRLFIKHLD